jgi:hypothetical protein
MTKAKREAIAGALARAGIDPDETGAEGAAGGGRVESFDWAFGEDIAWLPGPEEAARNEARMAERYRNWAATNIVTYAPGEYESAFRSYRNMRFETVNPVDDTVEVPPPRWDERLKKWSVPKNVHDENALSRWSRNCCTLRTRALTRAGGKRTCG